MWRILTLFFIIFTAQAQIENPRIIQFMKGVQSKNPFHYMADLNSYDLQQISEIKPSSLKKFLKSESLKNEEQIKSMFKRVSKSDHSKGMFQVLPKDFQSQGSFKLSSDEIKAIESDYKKLISTGRQVKVILDSPTPELMYCHQHCACIARGIVSSTGHHRYYLNIYHSDLTKKIKVKNSDLKWGYHTVLLLQNSTGKVSIVDYLSTNSFEAISYEDWIQLFENHDKLETFITPL